MKTILKIVAIGAILYLSYVIAGQALMLSWIHAWVQDHFGDLTGADRSIAWLVTLALFALIRLVRWQSVLVAPVTGRAKSLLAFAGLCLAVAGALKFTHTRILFDSTGNSRQSYIETPGGPLIVDSPPGGIDPKTGLTRKALTAEKLRAITLGKGSNKEGITGDSNHYFNAHDGGNKIWFVEGSCETRDVEGYDDRGRKLLPATAAMVDRCEKLRAEAELQRKTDAENQARRQLQEQRKARRHEFQEIGTYTAAGRYTVMDDVKISFEECLVLKSATRLTFRVTNIKNVTESTDAPRGRFEFGLLNSDGTETPASSVRRVRGAIAVSQDGALVPSGLGQPGWVVIEFTRDSESDGFAIGVNHVTAFADPAGHIVAFRKF